MHAFAGIAGSTRSARRLFLSLVVTFGLTLGLTSAPAHAAEPDNRGLFGSQDPTYDGVYRQSAAILGLTAVGTRVPASAVGWLLRQQCADGSFGAYRPDPSQPCTAPDPANYTGPDSNSTAMAVMALQSLVSSDARPKAAIQRAAKRGAAWLAGQQQADGGWEWIAGLGSDSTSTAMALAAVGRRGTPGFRAGAAWLADTMMPTADCAMPFIPGGTADPLSTSWTLLGAQGSMPYSRYRGVRTTVACPATPPSILAAGTWLANTLVAGEGRIASAFTPEETDWNSTALATLAMTQRHGSTEAMRLGVAALKANVVAYARPATGDLPAALGTLLMVAHASGGDPTDFGGVDLRRSLLATLSK